MPDEVRAPLTQFVVSREDGRDLPGGDLEGAEYIVLDITNNRYATTGVHAYARSIARKFPELAESLRAAAHAATAVRKAERDGDKPISAYSDADIVAEYEKRGSLEAAAASLKVTRYVFTKRARAAGVEPYEAPSAAAIRAAYDKCGSVRQVAEDLSTSMTRVYGFVDVPRPPNTTKSQVLKAFQVHGSHAAAAASLGLKEHTYKDRFRDAGGYGRRTLNRARIVASWRRGNSIRDVARQNSASTSSVRRILSEEGVRKAQPVLGPSVPHSTFMAMYERWPTSNTTASAALGMAASSYRSRVARARKRPEYVKPCPRRAASRLLRCPDVSLTDSLAGRLTAEVYVSLAREERLHVRCFGGDQFSELILRADAAQAVSEQLRGFALLGTLPAQPGPIPRYAFLDELSNEGALYNSAYVAEPSCWFGACVARTKVSSTNSVRGAMIQLTAAMATEVAGALDRFIEWERTNEPLESRLGP
jgi:hypothetical protein